MTHLGNIAAKENVEVEPEALGIIARAAEIQTVESQLRWWDVPRYSNRQHTKLKMGGFVGSALYQGAALAEFLPLLIAGEILRLGKGTSFGLGKYLIE